MISFLVGVSYRPASWPMAQQVNSFFPLCLSPYYRTATPTYTEIALRTGSHQISQLYGKGKQPAFETFTSPAGQDDRYLSYISVLGI